MTFCIKNEDTKEVILEKKNNKNSYKIYRIIAHKMSIYEKLKIALESLYEICSYFDF